MILITELSYIFAIFNFSIHISPVPLLCAVVFLFYLGLFLLDFVWGFFSSIDLCLTVVLNLYPGQSLCLLPVQNTIYTVFNFLTGMLSKIRLLKQWHLMDT